MSNLIGLKNKLFNTSCVVFSIFLLFGSPTINARWAALKDEEIVHDFVNHTIEVHKDGSYVETTELQCVPNYLSGVERLSDFPLPEYNKSSSTMEILEAKTIVNGKEYHVDPRRIQDLSLTKNRKGFDPRHKMILPFPNMDLNAKAYIKYRTTVKTAETPGAFCYDAIAGTNYIKQEITKITSEVPLNVSIHDPESFYEVKQNQNKAPYTIEIISKKPILKYPKEESYWLINSKDYPWAAISIQPDWKSFGKILSTSYEGVINQKLPDLFEKIVIEAKTKATTLDKINTVTNLLWDTLNYRGNWHANQGKLIPRDLETIAKTKYGDCKDFAAMTVAILRNMGIKANVALVKRQVRTYDRSNPLPNIDHFNHAVVRVNDGENGYWIDPTYVGNSAKGIYPEISNRDSLVLDPRNPEIQKIPPLTPKDTQIHVSKKMYFLLDKPEKMHIKGSIAFTGISATPLVSAASRNDNEKIYNYVFCTVMDVTGANHFKIEDFHFDSDNRNEFHINFNYNPHKLRLTSTAEGEGIIISSLDLLKPFLIDTQNRSSDLWLETPQIYHYEQLITKAKLISHKPLNCTIDTPWLKATRNVKNNPEGIKIVDDFEIKQDRILLNDLKSPEFSQLQNQLKDSFGDQTLIYTPLNQ